MNMKELIPFFRKTPADHLYAGTVAAKDFLAKHPSDEEILSYYSSACEDQEFAKDSDYAKGVKLILNPHRVRIDQKINANVPSE